MKIRQIALGWWSLLKSKFDKLPLELKELSINRESICSNCEHKTWYGTCGICGCVIAAKSKVFTANCPDNRWKPIHYYEGMLGDIYIVCEEVTPLLRSKLYKYLDTRPETIRIEQWEEFLNEF